MVKWMIAVDDGVRKRKVGLVSEMCQLFIRGDICVGHSNFEHLRVIRSVEGQESYKLSLFEQEQLSGNTVLGH